MDFRRRDDSDASRTGDDVFAAAKRIKPTVINTLDPNPGCWTRVREIHRTLFLIDRLEHF